MAVDFLCGACLGKAFVQYDYPVGWEKRLEIERGRRSLKGLALNNGKFLVKAVASRLPDLPVGALTRFKEKSQSRRWLSRSDMGIIEKNLKAGAAIFSERVIRVCSDCGFGAVFPAVTEQVLSEYYSKVYWLAQADGLEACENPRTETIYNMVSSLIPFGRITKTLEFGSASAQLSRYFQKHQPHLEISVVEAGENWQTLLGGHVTAVYPDIFDVPGEYDLFLSSHSLEHVPDIQKYFRKIVDLVVSDGYLIFEVPNSVEAEVIFHKTKGDYHIPHTCFFTEESLRRLARQHGLEIVVMKTYNRSYSQILNNIDNGINGTMENPNGAYLRVMLRKNA